MYSEFLKEKENTDVTGTVCSYDLVEVVSKKDMPKYAEWAAKDYLARIKMKKQDRKVTIVFLSFIIICFGIFAYKALIELL